MDILQWKCKISGLFLAIANKVTALMIHGSFTNNAWFVHRVFIIDQQLENWV
jgi:hypothetical protein